jgi:hypothetical protein
VKAGNSTRNSFSTDGKGTQLYTTDYVTKQLGEGINGMCGRAEYLNIPMVYAETEAHVLGAEQSVYEDPDYRELYVAGQTEDTYTKAGISGKINDGEKPVLVTTADEVMRHDSEAMIEGEPARPADDFFQFGFDFLTLYCDYGVKQGSPLFPVGIFNDPDEYNYYKQLEAAYANAQAEGLWAGTPLMESIENYYIYGAMIHFELIPESMTWNTGINTREELYNYDEALYRVLCGVHGRYHWFTGTPEQSATRNDFQNDVFKNSHPWFWMSQVDNYENVNGQMVEREPLAIEHVDIISNNQIEIKFNREIKTITPAADASNWKVYIDGEPIPEFGTAYGWYWDNGWHWGPYNAPGV